MVARKITINRLAQDELIYELKIRGISTGTCEEMRHNLAQALQLEKSGDSVRYPKYPYDFESDSQAVSAKLSELAPKIDDFTGLKTSGKFLRYQTALSHALGRIDNMTAKTEDEVEEKSELLTETLRLMGKLDQQVKETEKEEMVPAELSLLEEEFQGNIGGARRSTGIQAPQTSAGIQAPQTSAGTQQVYKPIPPSKWGIKFSGEKKDLSLNAFLERVEELKTARHVSEDTLLDSGIDLFTGKAYIFYKANRHNVTSWDELVCLFREEYHPVDYNERLFDEIKKRTQGPEESIGMYLATMMTFFKRLTCPISEQAQLKILLRNVSPYYQQQLALVDITSIAELRTLCKKLEGKRQVVQNFAAPTRRGPMLEPDLAYLEVEEELGALEVSREAPRPKATREVVCYRCHQPGHRAVGCVQRRSIFCYACKKEGYTTKTCPDCATTGNGRQRT